MMFATRLAVLLSLLELAVSKNATNCVPSECLLPECRCWSLHTPGGYPPEKIPQVVLLTFDDAININNYKDYETIFKDRMNPNNCPITATYYVSHEYTDYSLLHDLWLKNHEIASHSISHKPLDAYWNEASLETWADEMNGAKIAISEFGKVPIEEIQGMRSPFLKNGGDTMYSITHQYFHFDNSWPSRKFESLFPYTLDYKTKQDCYQYPCDKSVPTQEFNGTWVVPMIDLIDGRGQPCAMLDACQTLGGEPTDVYNMLLDNFERRYSTSRAHFGLYLHHAWLQNANNFKGYLRFLDKLAEFEDVYIVSVSQFLDWVKQPVTLANIKDFKPWLKGCEVRQNTRCKFPTNCYFSPAETSIGSERYMKVCGSCPVMYPWVGNPLGLETQ